ncbi:uncharacterized protein LOC124134367 [Haliotis rufescens]|uniref:uncharacterized protein LOC124134367 n=1 Tax=Haliotis rufescens TaxID=6454 RepID=UPI001EAFF0F4|nr:uncharacterized protein LOC124134367 [Haliotis rufescens]
MQAVISSLSVIMMGLAAVTSGMKIVSTPCMSNCTRIPDGDYQSCMGCTGFATCLGEMLYERKCVGNTMWDDSVKRCEDTSSTCTTTPPTRCVSSCYGVADGDHQSCNGCNVYVTCHAGRIFDNRPCPLGLVFNDNDKICAMVSPTCP